VAGIGAPEVIDHGVEAISTTQVATDFVGIVYDDCRFDISPRVNLLEGGKILVVLRLVSRCRPSADHARSNQSSEASGNYCQLRLAYPRRRIMVSPLLR
jgi:hypothetical protein